MQQTTHHSLLMILVALVGASVAKPVPLEAAEKPNIVFLLADDLGWTGTGSFGSDFYETPNLDQLASEGTSFTNAYAASPLCSPTRASIMTGKYPARMDTTDWFGAPQPETAKKHWTKDKPLLPASLE